MNSWLSDHWVPLSVLLAFGLVMILSAWRANRVRVSRPGPFLVAMSFFATFLSTNTFLGQAGFGYKVGIGWMLGGIVFVLCAVIAWLVVAPRMIADARRSLGPEIDLDQITVPLWLRLRYKSERIGYLSAAIVLAVSLLYVLAVMKGVGHILSQLLGVSYENAIAAVFALVVAYTSWGMIRAILHTDAIQGVVMVFGAAALFVATVGAADWGRISVSADLDANGQALGPALLEWSTLMAPAAVLSLSFATGVKLMVAPRLMVRFLLFREATPHQLRRAKVLVVALCATTIPVLFSLGILAHGVIPQDQSRFYFANTDQVIPYLVDHLFGPFWGAMVLGAFLCAALSSIDSSLHVAGSAIVVDLWARINQGVPEEKVRRYQRLAMIPTGAFPALIAFDPPADVVYITALSGAMIGACFVPAGVLALWGSKVGEPTVFKSMIAGAVMVVVWSGGLGELVGLAHIHEVIAGLVVSSGVFLAGSRERKGKRRARRAAAGR